MAASYWRVRFSAGNGSDIWLAEIEFFDAAGTLIPQASGTPISAGDYSAAYDKQLAFDGVKTTANNGWASATIPTWIGKQFAAPVEVSEARVYISPWTSASDELPVAGGVFLDRSDDGVAWVNENFEFNGSFAVGGVLVGIPYVQPPVVLRRSIVGGDVEFGGQDTLSGVVKRRIGSSDVPQMARVSLLRMRDKALARQAWSDPETGAFSFPGMDTTQRFVTLAEYPNNPDNPDAEDYLRPVAGVSLTRGEA